MYNDKEKVEGELMELAREYEKEHSVNNELREKLIKMQQEMQ